MTELKNAAISAQVLALVQAGSSVQEAIDAVLGAGTYAKIASDLHDAFNA